MWQVVEMCAHFLLASRANDASLLHFAFLASNARGYPLCKMASGARVPTSAIFLLGVAPNTPTIFFKIGSASSWMLLKNLRFTYQDAK